MPLSFVRETLEAIEEVIAVLEKKDTFGVIDLRSLPPITYLDLRKNPEKFQLAIDEQVRKILEEPYIGELKKRNLKGIRVYKFEHGPQLLLISYEVKENTLFRYAIGSHENFYKKLKMYLR